MDLDGNHPICNSFTEHRNGCGELSEGNVEKVPLPTHNAETWLSLQVCNTTTDRKHADTFLERCVTESVMNIVSGFFNSPFSDNSTSLQVTEPSAGKLIWLGHPFRHPENHLSLVLLSVIPFLTWPNFNLVLTYSQ